jgi:phosphoglycolate phosphatase-like HAD superfamily hydrolase
MKLPRPPAAVIFDMDGLLFGSETLYLEAAVSAVTEIGHDAVTEVFYRMVGVPWTRNREILLEHYGAAFPVDDFVTVWLRHFDVIAETRLELKPGALELLGTLDEMRLPRAIATSSSHRTVERHLSTHGLAGRFDAIVGHGDYESGKPAPDPVPESCRTARDRTYALLGPGGFPQWGSIGISGRDDDPDGPRFARTHGGNSRSLHLDRAESPRGSSAHPRFLAFSVDGLDKPNPTK